MASQRSVGMLDAGVRGAAGEAIGCLLSQALATLPWAGQWTGGRYEVLAVPLGSMDSGASARSSI